MNMSEQVERGIALKVIERIYIKTPRETDQLHIYQDGIYIDGKIANSRIKQILKEIAGETLIPSGKDQVKKYRLSIAKQNMIIDFIKSFTYCSLDDFDSNERIINTKNGLYYLDGFQGILLNPNSEDGSYATTKDDTLITGTRYFQTHQEYIDKHNEPYKSLIQIPVKYNLKAENLEIDQILEDIFGFDFVPLIYEMIGYFLISSIKFSKAFMLYGDTDSGKTTALNIITQIIGNENMSGIELQKLDDKFELEKTRNKLVNIFDDLSSKPMTYVGNFKKLVTNSSLYGRIKFLQDEIHWINRCKGLFACNVLPTIKEYVTYAFYKRWVLIPCFNDMKKKEVGKFNRNLRDKKFSEEELSGLFNKAIQALMRLEERSNFPEEWQDIEFVKNQWNMDINPIALFIEECCNIGDSHYEVDYELLYNELNKFRKEKRVKPISKNLMTRSLHKLDKKIVKKKVDKKFNPESSGNKFIGLRFNFDYATRNIEVAERLNLDNYLEEEVIKKE